MDLQLAGKRAIVTGGSRGIGKAVARALAAEGCNVVVAARGQEALQATATELAGETTAKFVAVPVDTSSGESVKAMVDAAVQARGGVDILVTSAARPAGQAPAPRL